jgi:hypothetical protein
VNTLSMNVHIHVTFATSLVWQGFMSGRRPPAWRLTAHVSL